MKTTFAYETAHKTVEHAMTKLENVETDSMNKVEQEIYV